MKRPIMIQYFEWYLPADAQHWIRTAQQAERLAQLGFTALWLPPSYKAANGIQDVGYGVYDLYDLGEFDQKGTIPTKYGTKQDYLYAINSLRERGIQVYADIVLNHKMGADGTEQVPAVRDDSSDRTRQQSGEETIQAWTLFQFPGRNGMYSDFTWNWTHFDGTDWDDRGRMNAVYRFHGKSWDREVDSEHGSYDYLMGADLDMDNPETVAELDRWGLWYLKETGVDGFRLDAVKHIEFDFYTHWLSKLREQTGMELPAVGEYWSPELQRLTHYLDKSGQVMSLFDVPLHFHLYQASCQGREYDLRRIFEDTLVDVRPESAVTFVDNHDTQPGQALESWISPWFRLHAYALTCLRKAGMPCVFYGDLYGIPNNEIPPLEGLETLLLLRQHCLWGRQTDYFLRSDLIGWTLSGDEDHPESGMAVLVSSGGEGEMEMCLGAEKGGLCMKDRCGGCQQTVVLDETGCGRFPAVPGKVSLWVSDRLALQSDRSPVVPGEQEICQA